MIKKLNKIMVLLLSLVFLLTASVACTKPSGRPKDDTKTQLSVFNFGGGVGRKWLDDIIADFESEYANHVFETGKKGIQISVTNTKSISAETVLDDGHDVIFTEGVDYANLVVQNRLLNINDIIDTPLTTVGGTASDGTIRGKLREDKEDFLFYKAQDEIYALPHYTIFPCVTYNKQLFDDEKLYFAKVIGGDGSDISDKFIDIERTVKSCGPDGVEGTADDGLPATWDEMFILSEYMLQRKGITPFCLARQDGYFLYFLASIYLNLANKTEVDTNLLFDSNGQEINVITDWNGTTPVYEGRVITESNYSDMVSQLNKYRAFEYFSKLFMTVKDDDQNNNLMDARVTSGAFTMTTAQTRYIMSYDETINETNGGETRPMAMLVEGSYWYNEADELGNIDKARSFFPDFEENNKFNVMPLPRVYNGDFNDVKDLADAEQLHKPVIVDLSSSYAFINASTDVAYAAKTFLMYNYTDKALKDFTYTSGVFKDVDYQVDTANFTNEFQKSVAEYVQNCDMGASVSSKTKFINNPKNFLQGLQSNFWTNTDAISIVSHLNNGKTVKDYFTKMPVR